MLRKTKQKLTTNWKVSQIIIITWSINEKRLSKQLM